MQRGGFYVFLRYLVAFLILFYGFAKINGAQFTVTESVLDQPLSEVPGHLGKEGEQTDAGAQGALVNDSLPHASSSGPPERGSPPE